MTSLIKKKLIKESVDYVKALFSNFRKLYYLVDHYETKFKNKLFVSIILFCLYIYIF